ncbi:unnamed protein product [Brachionus calyciflorus]|uniref:Uncharacterized protein n=1 Tax=Brachionus calyciflorus TaxID=104777 RepID=A0A813ZFA1_9BILA|nr:unnamed protein product [Brachionus calyciflorus]
MAEKQALDGERNMEKTYQSFVGPVNEVEDGEIVSEHKGLLISSYVEKKQSSTSFNKISVLRTVNQLKDYYEPYLLSNYSKNDIDTIDIYQYDSFIPNNFQSFGNDFSLYGHDEHQDEVSVLKNTIFDLELKIRNIEGINKSEKDLIRNISYDFEEVNDHHDSLRNEITNLKNQLNLSELKYSNLLNDYEVTNNLITKSEQDKNKYMDNIDNLRSEITKIQESHSKDKNESLKIELIESVKHIEELNILIELRYENCPKNPRNARFINLISQLTISNSSPTNELLKENDKFNEIFDKFETKERECSELNEELMSREYRIYELENEINSLTEQIQDLQETFEESILPSGENNVGPKIVGKYDRKGARRGLKFSDNLIYFEFFLFYDTTTINLMSSNLKENLKINIRKNSVVLNEEFLSKLEVKFNKNGLISLNVDDLFQLDSKRKEI